MSPRDLKARRRTHAIMAALSATNFAGLLGAAVYLERPGFVVGLIIGAAGASVIAIVIGGTRE